MNKKMFTKGKDEEKIKEFSGYKILSTSSCVIPYNGKIIEKTIKKAFPKDHESTLYAVKVKGVREILELYEDEMCESYS